jgi:O-antigen/teichoic acid export membrane protein
LLTRALGPEAYGIWVAASVLHTYLSNLSGWGVDVYLIRRRAEPSTQDYHQAFSLLLVLGLAGALFGLLALPILQHWMQLEGLVPLATVLFIGLPVGLVTAVPSAILERALDYRKVALIELAGLITFYPVALPLAYRGWGPWAPVAGSWAAQLLTLGLLYQLSGYRPRLQWEAARIRAMVSYGLGFSSSEWIWNLGNLVNPLIVGRYAGAEAVGQVGLAIRLVEHLAAIALVPASRLAIPVLARVSEEKARLVRALSEGTTLQIVSLGPVLAGIGLIAPWIIPLLIGPGWLPALEVYPFIATAYLVGSAQSLHTSLLFVLGKLREVVIFRLTHLVIFAGSALLLVPQLGLRGYGWADLVALPAYSLLLIWNFLHVGRPISVHAVAWLACWILPLFTWELGYWTWTGVVVLLLLPATRRQLLQVVAMVWKSVRDR